MYYGLPTNTCLVSTTSSATRRTRYAPEAWPPRSNWAWLAPFSGGRGRYRGGSSSKDNFGYLRVSRQFFPPKKQSVEMQLGMFREKKLGGNFEMLAFGLIPVDIRGRGACSPKNVLDSSHISTKWIRAGCLGRCFRRKNQLIAPRDKWPKAPKKRGLLWGCTVGVAKDRFYWPNQQSTRWL